MEVPCGIVLLGRMKPEKMRMQMAAEELAAEIDDLLPVVKRHARNAADHLDRSCDAVLFNMAEGVGAFKPRVKISAYEVARKEANELRAILRRIVMKRVLSNHDINRAYNLTGVVIGMLTQAMRTLEKRDQ